MTAVESNAALLAKAHTQALECGVTINSISAANVHKKVALAGGVADLVTVMHGIHLVDTDFALEECHRLLKPDGWLVLAWNDRSAAITCYLSYGTTHMTSGAFNRNNAVDVSCNMLSHRIKQILDTCHYQLKLLSSSTVNLSMPQLGLRQS